MTLPSQSAGRTPIFDETTLLREIAAKWGGYGAHAQVYAMLLKDRDKLKGQLEEAVEALKAIDLAYYYGQAIQESIARARALLSKLKEAGS